MKLNTKYNLGQLVYLITDTEQLKRIVTGITIRETGTLYELSQGVAASDHYESEMSETEDTLLKVQ